MALRQDGIAKQAQHNLFVQQTLQQPPWILMTAKKPFFSKTSSHETNQQTSPTASAEN